MINIRRADERGHVNIGWLNSHHTFSFGHYYDPKHMGFGALRVINDDTVQPGMGFDTHGHQDMEIISYVLKGGLAHKDSIGTGSVILPGEVQRMTAGTGIRHSEFNDSDVNPAHFLQIWILPDTQGLEPGYEQKFFGDTRNGTLKLVASKDARGDSLKIHQDMDLYATVLNEGDKVTHSLKRNRDAWIQVADGSITLNGQPLDRGDGAAINNEDTLTIQATTDAEVLLFDMPSHSNA
ncbi:MAG: pirin family protein [Sneathiella sp.]|nr:pirin family protein [Sneathiella sp.]